MKKPDKYRSMSLEQLYKKEWSSRHKGKYFACPSCGARFHLHCEGCKLDRTIREKEIENHIYTEIFTAAILDSKPRHMFLPIGELRGDFMAMKRREAFRTKHNREPNFNMDPALDFFECNRLIDVPALYVEFETVMLDYVRKRLDELSAQPDKSKDMLPMKARPPLVVEVLTMLLEQARRDSTDR